MDPAPSAQPEADGRTEVTLPEKPPRPGWTKQGAGRLLAITTFDEPSHQWIVNPSLLAQVLLSAGVVLFSVMLYAITLRRVLVLGQEWQICPAFSEVTNTPFRASLPLLPDQSTIHRAIDALSGDQAEPVLPAQKIRLKEQIEQLQRARRSSCSIGIFFFANRNATLTVATASAILALGSLAFVSKRGWDASNNLIINIGVTSGLILFTSWTFGQLYGQELNFVGYRDKYILSTSLLNEVASAVASRRALLPGENDTTTGSLDLNNPSNMALLIQRLDRQLVILHTPDFGGDSSFVRGAVNRVTPFLDAPPEDAVPQGQGEGS